MKIMKPLKQQKGMGMPTINLQRFPDGSLIDWGRNWRNYGMEGYGSAKYYSGEAAKVLELVLKYSEGKDD